MKTYKHLNMLSVLVTCTMLIACSGAPKKQAQIIDNDSYYSQPGSYQPGGAVGGYTGCAQINDSPSCGGG